MIQQNKENKLYNQLLSICNEITTNLANSLLHDNITIYNQYNQNGIKIKIYKDNTIRVFKKGSKHLTIENIKEIINL